MIQYVPTEIMWVPVSQILCNLGTYDYNQMIYNLPFTTSIWSRVPHRSEQYQRCRGYIFFFSLNDVLQAVG